MDKTRVVIKKDFNIKKEKPGKAFSITTPMDKFIKEARDEVGRTDNTKFLPLEVYDPHVDEESPRSFIKSIKKKHQEAFVFSKWFYADGTYE